ncbi:hypothetical protein QFC24_002148 [Naganishia onofrii]|uniref:Uncharacterized protein n=1 Tax=Naganishia onofrii TaxID=1851511 RepID=A0ACC2XSF8_9TREE|nr:hypothetical protein QFC24_002148 [Naganishia onofrii]
MVRGRGSAWTDGIGGMFDDRDLFIQRMSETPSFGADLANARADSTADTGSLSSRPTTTSRPGPTSSLRSEDLTTSLRPARPTSLRPEARSSSRVRKEVTFDLDESDDGGLDASIDDAVDGEVDAEAEAQLKRKKKASNKAAGKQTGGMSKKGKVDEANMVRGRGVAMTDGIGGVLEEHDAMSQTRPNAANHFNESDASPARANPSSSPLPSSRSATRTSARTRKHVPFVDSDSDSEEDFVITAAELLQQQQEDQQLDALLNDNERQADVEAQEASKGNNKKAASKAAGKKKSAATNKKLDTVIEDVVEGAVDVEADEPSNGKQRQTAKKPAGNKKDAAKKRKVDQVEAEEAEDSGRPVMATAKRGGKKTVIVADADEMSAWALTARHEATVRLEIERVQAECTEKLFNAFAGMTERMASEHGEAALNSSVLVNVSNVLTSMISRRPMPDKSSRHATSTLESMALTVPGGVENVEMNRKE